VYFVVKVAIIFAAGVSPDSINRYLPYACLSPVCPSPAFPCLPFLPASFSRVPSLGVFLLVRQMIRALLLINGCVTLCRRNFSLPFPFQMFKAWFKARRYRKRVHICHLKGHRMKHLPENIQHSASILNI
jgi:hypothetical protein